MTWDDCGCRTNIIWVEKDTYQVKRIRACEARRGAKVKIGKPDASLTRVSGLAAVDALAGKLALTGTLDAAVGSTAT